MWVHTLYTESLCSVCSYSPHIDPEQHTVLCWDVSGAKCHGSDPSWTTTLTTTDSRPWEESQKRQNQVSILHPDKQDTHRKFLCPRFKLSSPRPPPLTGTPLLTNAPLPIMVTSEEGMQFSLTNLFLHPLFRITDLVISAPTVFFCKGDHIWQH